MEVWNGFHVHVLLFKASLRRGLTFEGVGPDFHPFSGPFLFMGDLEGNMEVVYRKRGDLVPYENNPRKNDGAVDAVAAFLYWASRGQILPK